MHILRVARYSGGLRAQSCRRSVFSCAWGSLVAVARPMPLLAWVAWSSVCSRFTASAWRVCRGLPLTVMTRYDWHLQLHAGVAGAALLLRGSGAACEGRVRGFLFSFAARYAWAWAAERRRPSSKVKYCRYTRGDPAVQEVPIVGLCFYPTLFLIFCTNANSQNL